MIIITQKKILYINIKYKCNKHCNFTIKSKFKSILFIEDSIQN
jgi:hypothetical protein